MTFELDTAGTMSRLAVHRPIFHSEADFQFALAWLIQQDDPSLRVRLEIARTVPTGSSRRTREHLDLLVTDPVRRYRLAIELKYLPPALTTTDDGEAFNLSDAVPPDSARYDYVKDVQRLERFVDDSPRGGPAPGCVGCV